MRYSLPRADFFHSLFLKLILRCCLFLKSASRLWALFVSPSSLQRRCSRSQVSARLQDDADDGHNGLSDDCTFLRCPLELPNRWLRYKSNPSLENSGHASGWANWQAFCGVHRRFSANREEARRRQQHPHGHRLKDSDGRLGYPLNHQYLSCRLQAAPELEPCAAE